MKKLWISLIICLMLTPSLLVSAVGQSPVVIEMNYIVIRPTDEGPIAIMNMMNFKNTTEEEYKGDGKSKAVLKINLPKGANNLQVHDNSLGMSETDTGFITKKVIPAKESIVLPFSYRVEKNKDGFELEYEYPVQAIQFLVPEGSGSIQIKGLEYINQGLSEFEGTKYYSYSIAEVEANSPFTVIYNQDIQPSPEEVQASEEDGSAVTSEANTDSNNPALGEITHSAPVFHNPGHLRMWYQSPLRGFEPHVFMGVLVTILVGGIGYYSYFRWKNKLAEDQRLSDKDEQAFLQLIAKRKAIMEKILELDEGYSGGHISDDDYRKKLDAYKHHLLQVKLNLQKFTE